MIRSFVLAVAIILASAGSAHAQSQADPLGVCLADNTTGRDRKDLARWLFLAMAAHPDIKEFAVPTATTAMDDSAKFMGGLVTRLLTESCAEQAKTAIKSGGTNAFVIAFRKLGEVAMQEIMADPAVNAAIGQFEKYLDQERLKKLGQ